MYPEHFYFFTVTVSNQYFFEMNQECFGQQQYFEKQWHMQQLQFDINMIHFKCIFFATLHPKNKRRNKTPFYSQQ